MRKRSANTAPRGWGKRYAGLTGAALAALVCLTGPAVAQEEQPAPAEETPGETALIRAAMPIPAAVKGKSSEPKYPKFDKVMAGFTPYKGFFTIYKKKKDKMYAVVPSSLLGKDFALTTSFTGGTTFAGWQWNDYLFYWKKMGRRLVLMERNVFFTGGKGAVKGIVKRTYTDRVFLTTRIVTQGGGGSVIDLGSLLAGSASKFFGPMGGGNSSLAEFSSKEFPMNNEITVTMPGRGGQLMSLHYSIANYKKLSTPGFKPRVADDRVGYFLTANKDFGKTTEATNFVRYINRWNLQKRDKKLTMSPPKKPIVFYIEKTVPVQYRQAVREGIEMWNKAYAKCGYVNAIEVRQQEGDNEFKNLDPEDARYNFFRWIASERAFAMGPSRANPKTGEIYDADIIMDDSMVNSYLREYEEIIKDFNSATLTDHEKAYLRAHPRRNPDRVLSRQAALESARVLATANQPTKGHACEQCRAKEAARQSNDPNVAAAAHSEVDLTQAPNRYRHCTLGTGKAREIALASLWFALLEDDDDDDKKKKAKKDDDKKKSDKKDDDKKKADKKKADKKKLAAAKLKFINEIIREIVCHEVGHTLGLRHNFKASTYRSIAEINSKKKPADTTGSVMDYNPINLSMAGDQGYWAPSALGPYDYWAIEYGYKHATKTALAKIASRGAEKGLHYGTDEDVGMGDPNINRWDIGDDPIAYAKTRINFTEKMLAKIQKKAVKKGEGYQKLRRAFDMLLFEVRNAGDFAVRFVGGHHANRDHRGDPKGRDPVVPIAAKKQREGLTFVCEHVFSDKHFNYDASLLRQLAQSRWSHRGAYPGYDLSYPLHERVLNVQTWVMFDLFSPLTFRRLLDQEKMVAEGEDCFTMAELFDTLEASIWSELTGAPEGKATARKPFVSSMRRNLQKYYLEEMIDLAVNPSSWMPTTVGMMARHHLKRQKKTIEAFLAANGKNLDTYTLAHLEEAQTLITKALEAAYQLGGSGGGGGFFFF